MRARDLFERAAAPAPVEAPPKPGVDPDVKPGSPPGREAPVKHPNPFRRRNPGKDPGPLPRPKACVEARQLFSRERAIKDGRANPLPDHDKEVSKWAKSQDTKAKALIQGQGKKNMIKGR